ncbi:MAG: hypothetical protein FWD05_05885 [Oscillospiraceae bacterium]|nr:hypothetical protein [Oscillospiraceae bacterium]
MDYAQMKQEKEARYKEHCEKYAQQIQLQGYINSLQKDNNDIEESTITTRRGQRQAKKVMKINSKDIKMYTKQLNKLPPVPEFK